MKKLNLITCVLLVFCALSVMHNLVLADSITFFEHTYYGGDSFRLSNAGEISNLRAKDLNGYDNWNDEISSIEIDGDFKVTLYEDINFGGRAVTISLSRPYLDLLSTTSWDNRVSSIKWEPIFKEDVESVAIFYDQPNYQGSSFTIKGNGSIYRLVDKKRGSSRRNWNDQIRSVKVFGTNTLVVLYSEAKYRGSSASITESTPSLRGYRFHAIASSVKVFD